MAEREQAEAMEKIMMATLSRTIEFLKFAEAKNAALLTFCSAWIVALFNLILNKPDISSSFLYAFYGAIPLFVIAALITMHSFLPVLDLKKLGDNNDRPKNILYFKHISEMEVGVYRNLCRERFLPTDQEPVRESYLTDLAVQTVINGQITVRKFSKFEVAAYIVLAALSALGLGSVSWIACRAFKVCIVGG